MKIDIHTHTKKCKSGDAPTRAVSPENFCEAILSTAVRIVAITNHNVFDLAQYTAIETRLGKDAQVWPGIELDIDESGSRGHLLVIVSPTLAESFCAAVDDFTKGHTPDTFTATVEQVLRRFDSLKPLYVAHYKSKKPSLSDELIEKLVKGTKNPAGVIKEATNSISAGIYISHGHASIYGSDVRDWAQYEALSHDLPDLRLPVDTFEQFGLLLAKDPATINTALHKKDFEDLALSPFGDGSTLKLRAFNDINIIFGQKGTGKSCILKAIAKHYADKGIDARVFESGSSGLGQSYDTKGEDITIDLNDHNIDYCTNEIDAVRTATETSVTSLSKYLGHFKAKTTNRNAKRILLKDLAPADASEAKREFHGHDDAVRETAKFLDFLAENSSVHDVIVEDERTQITDLLSRIIQRLSARRWASFADWKAISLLNSAISLFRREVARKTGVPDEATTQCADRD